MMRLSDSDAYDVIVIGTGGIGSAALLELARRGVRVLGVDQFAPAHDHGSSHGGTRMIRQAYFEHPDYVPLLSRAYELWEQLEREAGRRLFYRCGLIEVGSADGVLIPGVHTSARLHGLELDELTPAEFHRRFPAFQLPDDAVAVYEAQAGYLLVEECVRAQIELAVALGAVYRNGMVTEWIEHPEHFTVKIRDQHGLQECSASRLIVCAGAWSYRLLAEGLFAHGPIRLRILLKHLHWCPLRNMQMDASRLCPAFFYELNDGYFYGFPAIDALGVKVGEHSGGQVMATPDGRPRAADPVDEQRVMRFVTQCLPAVEPKSVTHATCMYTMTPDEHFIVGLHPQCTRIAVAAGFSGHGFKFAPAMGQALADLACEGETSLPISFLSPRRFCI